MNKWKRVLSLFLCAVMVASALAIALPATAAGGGEKEHKRKVVAVVYDDSGSMRSAITSGSPECRYQYARYAMQSLIAMLDPRDTLDIIPMNAKIKEKYISVDLSGDRSAALKKVLETKKADGSNFFMSPEGGTPSVSIKEGIDALIRRGMKKSTEIVSTDDSVEYWLIILTDGDFDDKSFDKAVADYEVKGVYSSLRSIYLAFGKDAKDFIGNSITDNNLLTCYKADNEHPIADVMQQIASQLSGRYKLTSGITTNGKTVTIDLSAGYSLDSVTVIAQDLGGKLTSAKHNGSSLKIDLPCTLTTDGLSIKSGYSAVLKSTSGYLTGGTLELTFDANVKADNLSILVAPSVSIEPYILYEGEEVTSQQVNATLTAGKKIKVNYRAYDKATGREINLKDSFKIDSEKVTYCSTSYNVNDDFPVADGRNEISVAVSTMGGSYMLYGSLFCNIEKNPTSFRIEAEKSEKYGGDPAKTRVEFKIFLDDKPISVNDLKSKHYVLRKVEVTDNKGNSYPASNFTESVEGGNVVAVIDTSKGSAFSYRAKLVVESDSTVKPEDARMRECVCELAAPMRIPATLKMTFKDGPAILSQYEMADGSREFTFELFADGEPMSFENPALRYTVLFGGIDVTSYATIEDSILRYAPKDAHVSESVRAPGQKTLTVTVEATQGSAAPSTASATFDLQKTNYRIEVVPTGKDAVVDRFDVDASGAALYFRVICDGKPLSAAQLQLALDSGEIRVEKPFALKFFLLPAKEVVTVSDSGGQGLLTCRVEGAQPKVFSTFTSMLLFNGNKTTTLSYKDAAASENFTFSPSPAFAYIWRILVIILIVYLILYIIGFFKIKPLPSGVFVEIDCPRGNNLPIGVSTKDINLTFWSKWGWHLKRLLPWKLFATQSPIKMTILNYGYKGKGKNRKATFTFTEDEVWDVDDITADAFLTYRENVSLYLSKSVSSIDDDELTKMKAGEFRRRCVMSGETHKLDDVIPFNVHYFATRSRDQHNQLVITSITFFVRKGF